MHPMPQALHAAMHAADYTLGLKAPATMPSSQMDAEDRVAVADGPGGGNPKEAISLGESQAHRSGICAVPHPR